MKKVDKSFGTALRGIILFAVAILLTAQFAAGQSSYSNAWPYRAPITITNPTNLDLGDYQVQVTLGVAGPWSDAANDGSDLRFTAADGVTEMPYWIEEWTHGTSASIWLKVPAIAASGNTTIYMYYGANNVTVPSVFVATPPSGPFTKAAGNPIIPEGDPDDDGVSLLAENIVYDPVSQHYWMAFTNFRNNPQSVGLMWSDDPTDPDSWNWHSGTVIPQGNAPHLMEYNGTWYIFYSDRSSGTPYNIVVMSTTDLMTGTFSNKQVILEPSETWESDRVDEPFVFRRDDGTFMLVYMGEGANYKYQIGYATSDQLTGTYQRFNNGDPDNEGLFIPYGNSGSYDYGMACHPWVYAFGDTYYIGYTASSVTGPPYQTALATTNDWTTHVKHGIILPAGADGGAFRGGVTRIGDNYVFSYTRGSSTFTSGIAVQPVYAELSAAESSAEQVFDFYDGFSGTSLDLTKWGVAYSTQVGTIALDDVNGLLTITQPASTSYTKIFGYSSFGKGYLFETRTRHDNQSSGGSLSTGFNVTGQFTASGALRIGSGLSTTSVFWRKQASTDGSHVTQTNMAQTADENWHIFSIYREPSGTVANYRLDNNTSEPIAINVPDFDLNPFLMCYGNSNIITSDWIRVRKWAGQEITASVGAAEFNGSKWEGDESTDWHLAGNWQGDLLPDATRNVLISPGPANQPIISTEAAYCDNLMIETGASLTMSGTYDFRIKGNITNNGTITGSSGSVIFNGAAQVLEGVGMTAFHNLTLNSSDTVYLGLDAVITGDLNITAGVFNLGSYTCDHQVSDPLTGTLTVSDNGSIIIGATGTLPANFATYSFGPLSKALYSGSNQTVGIATYGNLILSGTDAVKTFPGNITILGNTTIKESTKALLANGTTSTTTSLILGTNAVSDGTWGSETSSAGFNTNTWFSESGTGILNVTSSLNQEGTWLGLISTNWNATSNWAGGIVPGSSTDVVIPAFAGHKPVISGLSTPALCNNLTIDLGATLTIEPGQALTVGGELLNNGSVMVESSWVNNNGSLIVLGTPDGSGTVSYKRFLREGDDTGDKHLLASPVAGLLIEDFISAFDAKIDLVRVWKEFDGVWEEIESGPFASGQGYNIYQSDASDGEFIFTGSLSNTAAFTATSPYADPYSLRPETDRYGNTDPTQITWATDRGYILNDWVNWGGGGWNLLGNPFTSAMDATVFISDNLTDFDPSYQALYVYDGPKGYYRYVASTIPGYEQPDYVQGGSFGNVIQTGQGFMVMANNNGVEFNFTPTMQVHNTVLPLLKSAATEDPWPGLKLKVSWGEKENLTTIVFNSEMKNSLDPGYDVGLLSAGPEVEIYTALVENDESINLTRQALPVAGADTVKIPVGIDCYAGGEVIFSAVTVPMGDRRFWLEDRTNGIYTDLTTGSYTVTLPENTFGTGRFFIIASTNTPTGVENPEDVGENLRIWVARDKIIVKGEISNKASCELYDIQGRLILERQLSDGDLNIVDIPSGLQGMYLVRVIDGLVITTRKIAIF